MKTKTIRQSVLIKADPHEVYETLMDSKRHSVLTASAASISRKTGGNFSVYGGSISGRNLELEQDRKIVQEWFCETPGWPESHYSKATFTLEKERGGTKISLVQENVPEAASKDIAAGWKRFYWEPMKALLEKKK